MIPNKYAFPVQEMGLDGDYGMLLRDYFAAQIMNGFISKAPGGTMFGTNHKDNNDNFARAAYAVADAMMRAREV